MTFCVKRLLLIGRIWKSKVCSLNPEACRAEYTLLPVPFLHFAPPRILIQPFFPILASSTLSLPPLSFAQSHPLPLSPSSPAHSPPHLEAVPSLTPPSSTPRTSTLHLHPPLPSLTVVLHGLGSLLGAVGRDPEDLDRHVRVDRVALRAGAARLRQLLPRDDLKRQRYTFTSHGHITGSCHTLTSNAYVTRSRLTLTSHAHVTRSRQTLMSHAHVKRSCHTLTSHAHVTRSRPST